MPLSVSDHLQVPASALEDRGAYDAILDVDSRLFIDPLLLRRSQQPEFVGVAAHIDDYLGAILVLLQHSARKGDVAWRAAAARLVFRELPGLCIGYTRAGTRGSGIGETIRDKLLATAKEIVEIGVQDPALFELLGLLEEGVGADRISDMFARIAIEPIYAYSERVFQELGIRGERFDANDRAYELPANPFRRAPILLLPRDVLRDLPVAQTWADIDHVIATNAALRRRVNELIGGAWRRTRHYSKQELRDLLLRNPDVLQGLLDLYKEARASPYDFRSDPNGQFLWYAESRRVAEQYPLQLFVGPQPSTEDVLQVVLRIAGHFKSLIEDHGLWKLLYKEDQRPKHEEAAQLLFYGIADAYCQANDLDLSRESNGGRGPVDFKLSRGYQARVVAEAKLSTNTRLLHGYERQVREYERAEVTDRSVFIVLNVGGGLTRLINLRERVLANRRARRRAPEVVIIDARRRRPASRA